MNEGEIQTDLTEAQLRLLVDAIEPAMFSSLQEGEKPSAISTYGTQPSSLLRMVELGLIVEELAFEPGSFEENTISLTETAVAQMRRDDWLAANETLRYASHLAVRGFQKEYFPTAKAREEVERRRSGLHIRECGGQTFRLSKARWYCKRCMKVLDPKGVSQEEHRSRQLREVAARAEQERRNA